MNKTEVKFIQSTATIQSWQPGGFQGKSIDVLIDGQTYIFATTLDEQGFREFIAVSVGFDDCHFFTHDLDGEFIDNLTWEDVEWFVSVNDFELPDSRGSNVED